MNTTLSEKDTKAVIGILVRELDVPEAQLTPAARLEEDLGADSLTKVEIAMAIEEYFELAIPDDDWERVSSVGDIFEELGNVLETPRRHRGQ